MLRTGAKQDKRIIKVKTPLGKDVLVLHHMQGTEELGRPFQFELEMLSSRHDLNFESILGQNITVEYELPKGGRRYFNGFVSEFLHIGEHGDLAKYSLQMRPWLWFLTRTADCRIFQKLTVPEIIKEVFTDNGFTDFEDLLNGSYRQWEYCVQYRETDFNFVSRLMEQAGIYYYFKHEDGKHTAILSDSISAHSIFPDYGEIPFRPPGQPIHDEHISNWQIIKKVQPGRYVLNEYDYVAPKADKKVDQLIMRDHDKSDSEIYDYPGEYTERGDGENYAQIRIEELHASYEIIHGEGDAGGLAVGCLFTFTDHPRNDQAREYLVTTAQYEVTAEEFESVSGGIGGEADYLCRFNAIHSNEQFRTARTTPKPVIQGPQTAVVVGPPGEEIHTDEYGRIKVQFHWDRYGRLNENSSCWIRVAQIWAGKQWGGVFTPRIGQEVMIEFLEGDPDQPIATGRVYNADHMPPYALPENKTQSGIKSRSSKGGTAQNFNEFRFEDKKGEENVTLHAERNLTTVVEANESRSVGGSRSTTIQKDETLVIKEGDRSETIEMGDDSLLLKMGDRSVKLEMGDDSLETTLGNITRSAPVGKIKHTGMRVETTGTLSIKLVCGASTIELTPASITISSPIVKINC